MDAGLKTWFRETFVEMLGYEFGAREQGTDYVSQTTEWGCWGCNAHAETSWPEWGRPNLKHESGCKYLEFAKEMDFAAPQS